MTRVASIVAWQPVLTDHMAHTLLEFSRAAGARLSAFAISRELEARRQQGWSVSGLLQLSLEILPRRGWVRRAWQVLSEDPDAVHVVTSPFGDIRIIAVLLLAIFRGREIYLVSEPYSPMATGYFKDENRWLDRMKACGRPALYAFYGALIRGRVGGVFAISSLAVTQYLRVGIPAARVFPFGYFIPSTSESAPVARSAQPHAPDALRLAFVGSLIRRKGVTPLVEAVRRVVDRGIPVVLDIYGPGDPGCLGADGRTIQYRGRIPFGQAGHTMANYDVLMVPSLHDGWGVVVNEALQAGVPVACSAQVGASVMVQRGCCGWVFENPDVATIASTIESIAADPAALESAKRQASAFSAVLEPAVAGRYMHDAICSARQSADAPENPWYP